MEKNQIRMLIAVVIFFGYMLFLIITKDRDPPDSYSE